MADETDNRGRESPASDAQFDWETLNAMIDGLRSDDAGQAVEVSAEGGAGDDPADDADFVGPTLPRVDPSELSYHKLRARRRRVLARRSRGAGTEPAAVANDDDDFDEEGEQEMAERLANRFAPANGPAPSERSVYAPRHGRRVEPEPAQENINPFDYALESELADLQPDLLPGNEAWRHGDAQPPDRGRAVLFGSIAVAALFLSGVSAFAVFGDWGERALRPGQAETSATASTTPATVVGLHDTAAQDDRDPGMIAPQLVAPNSADLAQAWRLAPRSVRTTPLRQSEGADAAQAGAQQVSEVPVETPQVVIQGPDPIDVPAVRGKSTDRLTDAAAVAEEPATTAADGEAALAHAPADAIPGTAAPADEAALAYTPADALPKTDAPADEAPALAYAPADAVPGTPAEPTPVRREIVGTAPPNADAAPADLIGQAMPHMGGSAEARAKKRRLDLLLARGREILKSGDLMSARLLFAKVAEAGDARGAIAMADTYDPDMFRKMKVVGLAPDAELSERWRARASELGAGPR